MIGIVIVAHGGLAREFLATAEHVVGPQPSVETISIQPDDDRSEKRSLICEAADRVDCGAGVILVTDMFGGSPSNLSLPACMGRNRRILYGANMPMLIKLMKSRHKPIAEAVRLSLDAGRKYIDSAIIGEERLRGWGT